MTASMPSSPVPPYTYNTPGGEPPFVLPESVELRAGIVYATAHGREWPLDLFRPRSPATRAAPAPAVVYLHGGSGTSQQHWRAAAHLAARGVPGVCVQHPLGDLGLPQAAVRWLRGRAGEFGVDPQRLGAVGGSASGRLVALLGSVDAPEDGVSSRVQAVVVIKGGASEGVAVPDSAPTLLIHGEADPLAPYEQSVAYHRRLRELGVRCDLHNEPSAVHRFPDRALSYERCLPLMERFLVEVLA